MPSAAAASSRMQGSAVSAASFIPANKPRRPPGTVEKSDAGESTLSAVGGEGGCIYSTMCAALCRCAASKCFSALETIGEMDCSARGKFFSTLL